MLTRALNALLILSVIIFIVPLASAQFFSDSFEDDSVGSVPGGWERDSDGSNGDVSVDDARAYDGSQSVISDQPSTGSPSHWEFWNPNFNPESETTLKFEYYLAGKQNSGTADRFEIRLTDTGNEYNKRAFEVNFAENGNDISARDGDGSGGGTETTLESIKQDQWVSVEIEIDFPNNEYYVTIDGARYGPFGFVTDGSPSDFPVLQHLNDNYRGWLDNFRAETTPATPAPAGSLWIEGSGLHWADGNYEYSVRDGASTNTRSFSNNATANLTIDGGTKNISGNEAYNHVKIINGGTLNVGSGQILNITANTLYVDSTSIINGDGAGYLGDVCGGGSGPGGGDSACSGGDGGAGAGYGGSGGRGDSDDPVYGGDPYGSKSNPTALGSGGGGDEGGYGSARGGDGGGSILLNVGEKLVLNGSITAEVITEKLLTITVLEEAPEEPST